MTIGQVLTDTDLITVFVNFDQPVQLVGEEFATNFIGSVATSNIRAGTLISADLFSLSHPLESTEAFVGVVVQPNQHPGSLAPGDRVRAIIGSTNTDDDTIPRLDAPEGVVEKVGAPTQQGFQTVRLRVDATDAERIAVAAAQSRVALIEIPAEQR